MAPPTNVTAHRQQHHHHHHQQQLQQQLQHRNPAAKSQLSSEQQSQSQSQSQSHSQLQSTGGGPTVAPENPKVADVERITRENPVVVFSKTYCPYCKRAMALLTQKRVPHLLYQLDTMENGGELQSHLASTTGRRTVPNIFIGGRSIGGCSELHKLDYDGELDDLLKKAFDDDAARNEQRSD